MGLTVKEHMTLQTEQRWWKYAGSKDEYVRVVFSESPTRYYQRVNALLDNPFAEAAYPTLVRRLRRLRDRRRTARSARTTGALVGVR